VVGAVEAEVPVLILVRAVTAVMVVTVEFVFLHGSGKGQII
jgi:hypothetical protein